MHELKSNISFYCMYRLCEPSSVRSAGIIEMVPFVSKNTIIPSMQILPFLTQLALITSGEGKHNSIFNTHSAQQLIFRLSQKNIIQCRPKSPSMF